MKSILISLVSLVCTLSLFSSCGSVASTSSGGTETRSDNNAEIKKQLTTLVINALGLDESLNNVTQAGKIKIELPPQWNYVKDFAATAGLTVQVNNIENKIDSVTNDLGKAAAPYLKAAIEKMTLMDALSIVNSTSQTSLTEYLRKTSGTELSKDLQPKVNKGLNDLGVNELWNVVVPKWNVASTLLGKDKLPTNLDQYVSDKSIDVIFDKIANQEFDMRTNGKWKTMFKK